METGTVDCQEVSQVLPEVVMGRDSVSDTIINEYRQNGFVKVSNLITAECANTFREEGLKVAQNVKTFGDDQYAARLTQQVNIWQTNDVMKQLTMSPEIAAIAKQLTGSNMRLWHDHLLSKAPNNALATEWHQDRPYWPFEGSPKTISVWIALQDTPLELGCMSFIPGSKKHKGLEMQDLGQSGSLFSKAPELEFEPKVTLPLKAGDVTFHNGLCAHTAAPNTSDQWRIAHVVIYIEESTSYSGMDHLITDKYQEEIGPLKVGDKIDGAWFPVL